MARTKVPSEPATSSANASPSTASKRPRPQKEVSFSKETEQNNAKRQKALLDAKRQKEIFDALPYSTGPLKPPSSRFAKKTTLDRAAVWVDLEYFKQHEFDLDAWLLPYKNWLGIKNDYNENVLRAFYSDLKVRTEHKDDELVDISFKVIVRDAGFSFGSRGINAILGIRGAEYNKWYNPEKLSDAELAEVYETSSNKPADMPVINRILHYVYSRIMTHKAGNFSSFANIDNPWLARLIQKLPINPGQLVCMELLRFLSEKSAKAPLPYPQLISHILEASKIKSTEDAGNKKCKQVTTTTLKRMGISVAAGGGTSTSKTQASRATSVPSTSAIPENVQEEVQSKRAPPTPPPPPPAPTASSSSMFPQAAVEEIIFRLSAEFQFAMEAQKAELLKPIHELQAQVRNLEENLCLVSEHIQQRGYVSPGTSSPHPSPFHFSPHHSSTPSPSHQPSQTFPDTQVPNPTTTPIDSHTTSDSTRPSNLNTQDPTTPIAIPSTIDNSPQNPPSHPTGSSHSSPIPTPSGTPPTTPPIPDSPQHTSPTTTTTQPSRPHTTIIPTPSDTTIASPSAIDSNPLPSATSPSSPPVLTQLIPFGLNDDKKGETEVVNTEENSEEVEEIEVEKMEETSNIDSSKIAEEIEASMLTEEVEAVVVNIARSYMDSDAHTTPPPSPSAQVAKDDLAEAAKIAQKHGISLPIESENPQPVSIIPAGIEAEISNKGKPSTGNKVFDEIQKLLELEAEKNKGMTSGQKLKGWRTKTTARKDLSFKMVPKASPIISKDRPRRVKMVAPKRPDFEEQNKIFAAEQEARRKASALVLEKILEKKEEAVKKKAEFEARTKARKESELRVERLRWELSEELAIRKSNRKARIDRGFKEVIRMQKEYDERKAILESRAKAKPEIKNLEEERKERLKVSEQIKANPELKEKKAFRYKRKIVPTKKDVKTNASMAITISEPSQKDPQEKPLSIPEPVSRKAMPSVEPVLPDLKKRVVPKKGMTEEERAEQIKLQKDKFFYSDSSLSDYPDEEFYDTVSGAHYDIQKHPPISFENSHAYKLYMSSSKILPALDTTIKADTKPFMHNFFDESEEEKKPSKGKKKKKPAKKKKKYQPGIMIKTDPSYLS